MNTTPYRGLRPLHGFHVSLEHHTIPSTKSHGKKFLRMLFNLFEYKIFTLGLTSSTINQMQCVVDLLG